MRSAGSSRFPCLPLVSALQNGQHKLPRTDQGQTVDRFPAGAHRLLEVGGQLLRVAERGLLTGGSFPEGKAARISSCTKVR